MMTLLVVVTAAMTLLMAPAVAAASWGVPWRPHLDLWTMMRYKLALQLLLMIQQLASVAAMAAAAVVAVAAARPGSHQLNSGGSICTTLTVPGLPRRHSRMAPAVLLA